MAERFYGFEPVFDKDSRVLVLGSFPSVKSRKIQFYYGNPQNRFWKMLSCYFGAPMPETTEEKKKFILGHGIALWDVVQSCEIEGSADDSIRNYMPAALERVLGEGKISLILLNGKKALAVFQENYGGCGVEYRVMPSTSPANPRYDYNVWKEALDGVFKAD